MHDGKEFLCMKSAVGRRLLTEEQNALWGYSHRTHGKIRTLLIGNPSEDLPESQQEIDILHENMKNIAETEITKLSGTEINKMRMSRND